MQSHWTVSKYRNAETSKISQSEAFANYHVTYYVHHWNLWHWLKENDQRRGVYLCRNDTYFVISSACEKTFTTFSLLVSIHKYHMQCLHTGFFKDVYLGNYKWRLASTLDTHFGGPPNDLTMHDHFKKYLSPYLSTIFILENANDFIFHSLPTNLLPHVKYVVSGFKMFDVHDELHQDNTSEKS